MLDDVKPQLNSVAAQLQERIALNEGTIYRLDDLQQALTNWLELSIEALVDDAMFHTIEGDRSQAFNRHAWENQLSRLEPVQVQASERIAA